MVRVKRGMYQHVEDTARLGNWSRLEKIEN